LGAPVISLSALGNLSALDVIVREIIQIIGFTPVVTGSSLKERISNSSVSQKLAFTHTPPPLF
jgi:hypothetical protein